MKSTEIRSKFLSFFESVDHRVVDSAPVVPQGDPTLLFTNAGMNQFKDLLLGEETRDYKRAASAQKCIRASGKHNDLDEVGRDGRHLTFFEMLGNWSFGDYYKRDAIVWAWEFVTKELKIDTDRLYVTVYLDDDESYDIWHDEVKVPADRILRLGKDDNYWSMGPTGPCGPCSEIHYDLRPNVGEFVFEPGYDDDRVVEFWNLVFMESDAQADGTLKPLPIKSVDTGMGLDRVVTILNGHDNIFQTDLFRPIHQKTATLLGSPITDWDAFFKRDDFSNYAVISDHVRSVLFALCDGAKFSNDGRGSVIRSILRRAVRFGRQLGFDKPFVFEVTSAVIETLGDVYPELKSLGPKAAELIRIEEERFLNTIDRGIQLFDEAAERVISAKQTELSGNDVFVLHATFGFPPDLTQVMAEERDLTIDWKGYQEKWAGHQEASKGKDVYADAAGAWTTIVDTQSEFVGYDTETATTEIIRIRENGDQYDLILKQTPFYAESGGQVGDTGIIADVDGTLVFEVTDTQKAPIGFIHTAKLIDGAIPTTATEVIATVDTQRRLNIASNHTATHMLHSALRTQISDEIFQSGSLVSNDKLRFDFSYGKPVTKPELAEMEQRINDQVRADLLVNIHDDVDRETAVDELGAMAIFGEKYGDKVRVVEIVDGESVELCGGIHVSSTAQIGLFRIVSESGVAAGIRRIEAVTNEGALALYDQERALVASLSSTLKTDPKNLLDRIEALLAERAELEKQIDALSQKMASADSGKLADDAIDVDGVKVVAKHLKVSNRDQLLAYADNLRGKFEEGVVLLAAEIDEKPALVVMVTDAAFKNRKLKAGDLINAAAEHVGGRGGGRPTLAQAGGSNIDGIPAAITAFESIVREALS